MRPHSPVTAYVALGSNVGNRKAHINAAVAELKSSGEIEFVRISSLLDNPAVGGPADSSPFLNAAAEIRTTLASHALLHRVLEIERRLGRERRQKWAPRTIDLDILLFGDRIISSDELVIPHPLMQDRRFVLQPLAEIAPNVVHPVLQMTIGGLLENLDSHQREKSSHKPRKRSATVQMQISSDLACDICGYNLRGLPLTNKCPECAAPVLDSFRTSALNWQPGTADLPAVQALAAAVDTTSDAVLFVKDAIERILFERPGSHSNARARSLHAADICGAIGNYASSYFNDREEAIQLLKEWKLNSSEDVGKIVFALVSAGQLAASVDDNFEEYQSLFTLETLLPAN